jgi:outer membrane protein assembly factor BamB
MFASARAKWVAGGLLAVVAIGAVVYFAFIKAPGDVNNGDKVEFSTTKPKVPPKPKKKEPAKDTFKWPVYGWNNQHTRYFPSRLRPPFRRVWRYSAKATVEISPLLIDGTLYLMNKHATLKAVSAKTGKEKWRKPLGSLSASTPAYAHKRLFITTLSEQAYSVNPRNKGAIYWKKKLPSRSESSPIVVGTRVYFGSENGTVYSLGYKTGVQRWAFHAPGAVKGSVAYSKGRVYFGTYGGNLFCLNARTGRQIWRASTSGLALGRSGNFYATPTLAFGRVYLGNTDGRVYSFSAQTGKLAWSHSTGNYVYGAAAAAETPKTRPTIYVGSYDHSFYALDAKTGSVRWTFPAGERISGAPTVIGSVVYFSTLLGNKTYGLNITNGKKVFQLDRGDYNPAIGSPTALYITAVNRIYKFAPRASAVAKKKAKAKAKAKAKKTG